MQNLRILRLRLRYCVSLASIVTCVFSALLALVLMGAMYKYGGKDVTGPSQCGGLLSQGEWLDPNSTSNKLEPFQDWQPTGCMLHTYTKRDIEDCFENRKFVLIGDSTIRQIYQAIEQKLGRHRTIKEGVELFGREEKHQDLEFNSGGTTIQFIWDPFLNSTALKWELETFTPRPLAGRKICTSAAMILVGAPGLWYARYGTENFFRDYREAIDNVISHMDNKATRTAPSNISSLVQDRDPSPNLLLMAPVQIPNYESLSPERNKTITPEKIDLMNDYLEHISASSNADLIWSYPLMTSEVNGAWEDDGIHVHKNVAHRQADVLFNLRCNAKAASKGYPYDRTCCTTYPHFGFTQLVMISPASLIIPMIWWSWLKRSARFSRTRQYFPKPEILIALTTFSVVLFVCFCADRTHLFQKVHKHFRSSEYTNFCIVLATLGLISIKRISNPSTADQLADHGFLSRHQTDEWKGLMQALILAYHYTGASKSLPIYQAVRVFVAAYLFLTGYGNTLNFLETQDYSLKRFAAMLVRLNLLAVALSQMMWTEYSFYYFPALVSFWFVIIYTILGIGRGQNSNPDFIVFKIALWALLTTAVTKIPGILEFVGFLLRITCRISWDMTEWRFRLALDQYIVYTGMLAALFHIRCRHLAGNRFAGTYFDKICEIVAGTQHRYKAATFLVAASLFSGFWAITFQFTNKTSYNKWHPYISFLPILCYIYLRNSHRVLRNYHSTIFAWLGKISLETFLLQYHIWLAADTKGLLRLGLFNRGIETAILTVLFLWLSHSISTATRKLTKWIVSDNQYHKQAEDLPILSPTSLRFESEGNTIHFLEMDAGGDDPTAAMSWRGGLVTFVRVLQQDFRWKLFVTFAVLWIVNITY